MITGEEWQVARRLWPDDEDTDFSVTLTPASDGTGWLSLTCSVHGPVGAAVTWDLGELLVTAERHYVLKHLRPRTAPVAQEPPLCACPGRKGCYCHPGPDYPEKEP